MPIPPVSIPGTARDGRERFQAAREVLAQGVAERAFPGAAYGVWLKGSLVALDAVGTFTYDPGSPEVIPATVYDLASLTKVVATTAVAMLLYDRGVLDLDARLGDVLPGFVIGDRHGSGRIKVTLRSLLDHSSGLPGYGQLFAAHTTPAGVLRGALQTPLEAPPGTRVEYSDIGFILLGKALEVLAGDILPRLFEREIAGPLGLASTRFCPPEDWRTQIPPTEHDYWYRNRVIQGEVQDENCYALGGAAGHAGLFSNALDVLNFAACILAGGQMPNGRQLFQPGTVALFSTRQTQPPGTTRALGWDTPSASSSSGRFFSAESIGHLGYAGTSLWIDPDRQLAAVLLTNRTWPDRQNKAIQSVRPAFHDALAAGIEINTKS
jgi:CubicO group peptidase (beta-lactamase class C family)